MSAADNQLKGASRCPIVDFRNLCDRRRRRSFRILLRQKIGRAAERGGLWGEGFLTYAE